MFGRPELLHAGRVECLALFPEDSVGTPTAMDAFSEVLSGVKLKGALFFSAEFSAPWAFSAPSSETLASSLAPGAPHLIIYHLVVDGVARAALPDGHSLTLEPGDIVVFPHGDPHELSSSSGARSVDSASLMKKIASRDLTLMRGGGGGDSTRFVCGFMACDPLLCAPILGGLPPMLKVNVRIDRAGQWLEGSLLHLVDEASSNRAGSEAMLAKVSEALFVDMLRRYLATLPEHATGWLAGARDPVVSRSLAIMHARVDHPWTIAELAQAVGVSRTALVDRFAKYLSEPPMAYLTRWRLQLAAQALTKTARGVADIAAEVGYESEAAFNRAFKRLFGVPPARYRREHRSGDTLAAQAQTSVI
jgi:AraC-like DNA-binding protein